MSTEFGSLEWRSIREQIKIDWTWIERIEQGIPALEHALFKPSNQLKPKRTMRSIEQARHMDAESLIHLMSHSHLVSMKRNRSIQPKQILEKEYREDIHTYENRFLSTLLHRLGIQVDKRITSLQEAISINDAVSFWRTGNKRIELANFSFLSENEAARTALNRLLAIQSRLTVIRSSPIAKELGKGQEIKTPLIMTNTLREDGEYTEAVALWTYLRDHEKEGFVRYRKVCRGPVDDTFETALSVFKANVLRCFASMSETPNQ